MFYYFHPHRPNHSDFDAHPHEHPDDDPDFYPFQDYNSNGYHDFDLLLFHHPDQILHADGNPDGNPHPV